MKKYQILIVVVLGILSFAASFGFNWFRNQKAAAAAVLPPEQTGQVPPQTPQTPGTLAASLSGIQRGFDEAEHAGLSERQLQHLIYDIREKMRDYAQREKELDNEAARLEIARRSLQEDIEHLNGLREKLDLSLAAMKETEERIQKSIVEIEAVERANLQRLAASYERMDVAQAGKIMLNMAVNNQIQDVVKILYYMNERSAGRLLGEIGASRPDAAGILSLQLKHVREGE